MNITLSSINRKKSNFVWEENCIPCFDELIISWGASRPSQGTYLIQASLFIENWTPWFDYALWGASYQCTFHQKNSVVEVLQDLIHVLQDKKATGFKIRVQAKNGASLEEFRQLHASMINRTIHHLDSSVNPCHSLCLDVPGLSQIVLSKTLGMRICSPTSLTSAIRYLLKSDTACPLEFAKSVLDLQFDIYGNWALNTAQAGHLLGKTWSCFALRFHSFNQVIAQLKKGFPCVVSIKGPLINSAAPYASGHLVVVKGYDATNKHVLCMDPAFPTHEETDVKYPLQDFLAAWNRRLGLAYVFEKSC